MLAAPRLRLSLRHHLDRLRIARPRLSLGRAAAEHRRLGPGLVERLLGGRRDRLRLLARELEQRAEHARVGALALLQRAEDRAEDVRHLAEERLRLARRLRRHELEHRRQVVGQLAGRQQQARLLVGLREIDHRRAAVARVAVHVLEQVQRRAAAAVEQLHVLGFAVERIGPQQLHDQRVELGERDRAAAPARGAGSRAISGRCRRTLGVGVGQQRGQRAQRARRGNAAWQGSLIPSP